jgi:hypothetical protein
MRKYLIILCVIITGSIGRQVQAQGDVSDTGIVIPMFYATYAFQLPGGDMAERFGYNSNVGGGFKVKTRNNWLMGADFGYIFGNQIKNKSEILSGIATEDGFLIDGGGKLIDVFFYERGFTVSAQFGKIIPVLSPNPNSGITITVGAGLMQHKIKLEDTDNSAPQIKGEYKKGYDKLTNGFSLNEFVGYTYFGNNRLLSFFAGFEFVQGFTQSRRSYDFNLGAPDTQKRIDLQYGIKIGWIVPLYKRKPKGYYFD